MAGLFVTTLLVTAVGLALLDPADIPWSLKLFNAIWNATNLVTTLGDFTPFTVPQKVFMIVASFAILVLGSFAVTKTIDWLTNPIAAIYRENRLMKSNFATLKDHVIIIGFSPLGRIVASLLAEGRNLLVIETREDLANQASEQGYLVLLGDAGTDDEVFTHAGIEQAAALIVTSESPDRKLAITLMAHARNSNLRIAVTAEDETRGLLLRRAGATDVVVADDLIAHTLIGHLPIKASPSLDTKI
ncbi:NAD-binding protein [Halothiobacillus sp. DCM-1]|uniref:NAD-binding protein n=1 Tax=Halothiobacillus sp. DCM-1 TaxID=3112558 RepID=UPI003248F5FC